MAGTELLQLVSAGVPGAAVLGYVAYRVVDRLVFILGLRMVLRATRREDRVAAITAYSNGTRRRRRAAAVEEAG